MVEASASSVARLASHHCFLPLPGGGSASKAKSSQLEVARLASRLFHVLLSLFLSRSTAGCSSVSSHSCRGRRAGVFWRRGASSPAPAGTDLTAVSGGGVAVLEESATSWSKVACPVHARLVICVERFEPIAADSRCFKLLSLARDIWLS